MAAETNHDELQDALDRSLDHASSFTSSLFRSGGWDAAAVASFVNQQRNITIAAVTAAGRPHAAVALTACLQGRIHFTVTPPSLLARCVTHNPTVAFTISDVTHAVLGRGSAVLVARSVEDALLMRRLAAATAIGIFTPPEWDGLIYCIEIERIFAS
jgi:hypothetical protein